MRVESYQTVDGEEARRLMAGEAVHVLDVRTPDEYEQLGHIPGAHLLPVDLTACAPAVVPRDGRPLLVVCEHGVRSAFAAAWLARAGLPRVLNLAGGMAAWTGAREWTAGRIAGPSPWLLEHAGAFRRGGRVLDVACGRGRHALLLAAAGFTVEATDRDRRALDAVAEVARRHGLPLTTVERDLESGPVSLGRERFDLVVVTNYLHRPLFPALRDALAPGGLLLYETYLRAHAVRFGKPSNPDHLLEPGELPSLVAPLTVLATREGEEERRIVAAILARRDGG